MLRFFRHIRKELMEKKKIKTYVFYALGEIVLVMVGILLALQINNWNEDRIERQQELKLLSQIQSDLMTTSESINDLSGRLEFSSSSADSLLQSLRTGSEGQGFVFHASLIHRRFFFNPTTTGYAQLETSSGNVIRNDRLRNEVVDLYEGDFVEIINRQNLLLDHMNTNLFPLSRTRFNLNRRISFRLADFDENEMDFFDPINFDELSGDVEFANTVVAQKRLYTIQLNQLEKTGNQIDGALSLINKEIEQLSSR